MSQILVIEDNEELAYGLQNNLEIEGYGVSVAMDGVDGLRSAQLGAADLIILDLMLPKLDGFRVLKALRSTGARVPVLVLTARDAEIDKVRGLKLGADDYVTKPFGLMELLARIEALLRRSHAGGLEEVHRFGNITVDTGTRIVSKSGTPVRLSPKETELLFALMRRRGRVASRGELMREVWGYADSVISRTVDTHIGELRRKLEDDPRAPRHLLTVKKVGYRLAR